MVAMASVLVFVCIHLFSFRYRSGKNDFISAGICAVASRLVPHVHSCIVYFFNWLNQFEYMNGRRDRESSLTPVHLWWTFSAAGILAENRYRDVWENHTSWWNGKCLNPTQFGQFPIGFWAHSSHAFACETIDSVVGCIANGIDQVSIASTRASVVANPAIVYISLMSLLHSVV